MSDDALATPPAEDAASPRQTRGGGAQTVDRALSLLKLVASGPGEGLRLADLAELAGLDRATAYRMLASLVNHGFVNQDVSSKRYTLGLEFFTLAAAASNRYDLADVARGALRRLGQLTGDTACFCARSGTSFVCVDVETGNFPIRTLPMDIGSQRPIGAGAPGIAMLAAMPDFEVEQVLKRNAAKLGKVPGQDTPRILAQMRACREEGFALVPEDPEGRIMGLAIALNNRRGRPECTLSINGIPERFEKGRAAELAAMMGEQAAGIAEAMLRMPENDRHRNRWAGARPTGGWKS